MKRHITSIPLFIIALLFAVTVAAKADRIDDFVKAEMQKQRITGLSLAVVKEGKIIKAEGYGLANIEHNVPARPETVYQIGSVSKQIIAAGIMLLLQEGKLHLDEKISKFLEGTPDTWKEITVRHLLTHTSGIVREAPGFDPYKIQNDADVIKTAYPLPLRFAPGEKWEYCNVGYFTLAEIIHKVTGKPWGDFLHERIFQPLGMNATRTTTTTEVVPNRADGYVWRDAKPRNADIFFALRPSGAFLSTVIDLAKWDAALYSDQILKAATREQMWTPVKLNSGASYPYGFGWELNPVAGHKRVSHSGSLPGFRATIARFVDDKLTVIVLSNADLANTGAVVLGVAEAYIPELNPPRTVARVDPKIFDAYVGQYQPNSVITLTISREGDKLMFQQSASPDKQELLPENESSFFLNTNRSITYSFVKDEKGLVTYLLVQNAGREVARVKKIK